VDSVAGVTLVSTDHGMLGCELYGLEEGDILSVPIAPFTESSTSAARLNVGGSAPTPRVTGDAAFDQVTNDA
jgi:hypothetical protein